MFIIEVSSSLKQITNENYLSFSIIVSVNILNSSLTEAFCNAFSSGFFLSEFLYISKSTRPLHISLIWNRYTEIMIIQEHLCRERNDFGANPELNEQTRSLCRQVGKELRGLGDALEDQYFRPLQGARRNRRRIGIDIGRNVTEITRFILLRCVRELLGLNN